MIETLLGPVGSLIPLIFVFGLVVIIHELGHYGAGRLFGAAVESFAVGFGKPIVERTDSRGTRWRINWIPLGGFVKFIDEHGQNQLDRRVTGRPYPQIGPAARLVVSLAGPIANFVLAIAIFAVFALFRGVEEKGVVYVHAVIAGQPAERAGFLPGDQIIRAGGRQVHTGSDVISATQFSAGDPVRYDILRDSKPMSITVVPELREVSHEILDETEKVGRIGLQMNGTRIVPIGPVGALVHGVTTTANILALTHKVILRVVMLKEPVDRMRGPVGIWSVSNKVADYHLEQPTVSPFTRMVNAALALLFLAGLLSVGIGYFNLLPLPILDGGAAVGALYEIITRRPLPEQMRRFGLVTALAGLICFALVVTWNDLKRIGVLNVFG